MTKRPDSIAPSIPTIARPRTGNSKTGDIPTLSAGTTKAESIRSCQLVECPLLHVKDGGLGGSVKPDGTKHALCYSHYGTPAMGAASARRAFARNPDRYTVSNALDSRSASARFVRSTDIGDPAATSRTSLNAFINGARTAGLAFIGYTHGWSKPWAQDLRTSHLASVPARNTDEPLPDSTLDQVDLAHSKGWRVAAVVPSDTRAGLQTPGGLKGFICPAIAAARAKRKRPITCNECLLCDAGRMPPNSFVMFPDHGPGSR